LIPVLDFFCSDNYPRHAVALTIADGEPLPPVPRNPLCHRLRFDAIPTVGYATSLPIAFRMRSRSPGGADPERLRRRAGVTKRMHRRQRRPCVKNALSAPSGAEVSEKSWFS